MPKMPACSNAKYGEMARTVFGKLKIVWRKQAQSMQAAAEATKTALGRQLPVPNATRWNSLFNAVKFIDEVPKGRVDAVFDALSLPRLQQEEYRFTDEYCKVYFDYFFAIKKSVYLYFLFCPGDVHCGKGAGHLQGEQYMYMGALQPTLHSLLPSHRVIPQGRTCVRTKDVFFHITCTSN